MSLQQIQFLQPYVIYVVLYVLVFLTVGHIIRKIGENRLKKLNQMVLGYVMLHFIGTITGIVLILIRPLVFMFFDLSDRAYEYLNIMMYINAYYVIKRQ